MSSRRFPSKSEKRKTFCTRHYTRRAACWPISSRTRSTPIPFSPVRDPDIRGMHVLFNTPAEGDANNPKEGISFWSYRVVRDEGAAQRSAVRHLGDAIAAATPAAAAALSHHTDHEPCQRRRSGHRAIPARQGAAAIPFQAAVPRRRSSRRVRRHRGRAVRPADTRFASPSPGSETSTGVMLSGSSARRRRSRGSPRRTPRSRHEPRQRLTGRSRPRSWFPAGRTARPRCRRTRREDRRRGTAAWNGNSCSTLPSRYCSVSGSPSLARLVIGVMR